MKTKEAMRHPLYRNQYTTSSCIFIIVAVCLSIVDCNSTLGFTFATETRAKTSSRRLSSFWISSQQSSRAFRGIGCNGAASAGRRSWLSRFIDDDDDDGNVYDKTPSKKDAKQAKPQRPSFQRMNDELAHEFFGDIFFYDDEQDVADRFVDKRRKKFGKKTAKEILIGAKTLEELNTLISGTAISNDAIKPYWDHVRQTPENILDGMQIPVNMETYLSKISYLNAVATYKVRHGGNDRLDKTGRNNNIHIVLGSSGSGKTAFAWKCLAKPDEIMKSANNGKGCCSFYVEALESFSLDRTIEDIKDTIFKTTGGSYDPKSNAVLNINMGLVIDEAARLKGKLDTIEKLNGAVSKLQELFKGDVRLIISGTGYDTLVSTISSKNDVYKYDMRPWSREKIQTYITNFPEKMDDDAKKAIQNCMRKYDSLAQLASNARMATLLISQENARDFEYIDKSYDSSVIGRLMNDCALAYVSRNGLYQSNDLTRKAVARVVMGQLDHFLKTKEMTEATFDQLPFPDGVSKETVIDHALSLVEQNYEVTPEGTSRIDESQPLVYVSPAITVILFMFLGVPPTVLAGWRLLEIVGAMTLLKRAATLPKIQTKRFENMAFDVLHVPVPSPRSKRTFSIPRKLQSCIWVNGPAASFGDYFSASEKVIGQAKYVSDYSKSANIDLDDECKKAGLFKLDAVRSEEMESHYLKLALLQALAIGAATQVLPKKTDEGLPLPEDDTLTSKGQSIIAMESDERSDRNKSEEDHIYPQSLLLRPDSPPVEMVICHFDSAKNKVSVGNQAPEDINYEKIYGWELHFLTNGKFFKIICKSLDINDVILIDRSKVDFDGNIVSEPERSILGKWCESKLRDDVKLHFFFAPIYL